MVYSPMQKVSSLTSSKLGDTLTNIQNWGNVFYNVQNYGIYADGTDYTNQLQALVNLANSEGRTAIFFPAGEYVVSYINNDENIYYFGDNARFVGGYNRQIAQIGGMGDGILYNIRNYGAKGDGVTNDSDKIQALIDLVGSKGKGTIIVPPGDYILNTGLDFASFASASGKPCAFVMMKGAKFVAAKNMDYMINLQSDENAQIQNGTFVFDHLDGQSFATFIIRLRGVSDSRIECGILQNGVSGFVSDMSGIPNYGNFNNNITIYKITGCSTNGFYAIGNMGDPHTDFQGNLVNIRQVIHCGNNGIQLNDNTVNRSWYNTFDIGALEENTGYGIYVNSGRNIIRVNSTNNNGVKGLGGPSSVERCNISGYFEDGMDQSLTEKNNINVQYPILKNGGKVSVVNGSSILHNLAFTPSKVKLTSTQSGHIVSAFSVNETSITIGLYGFDGNAITSPPEDVWWEAEV